MKKYLLIVVPVLVLLAAGAGAYWFFVYNSSEPQGETVTLQVNFFGDGVLKRKEGANGWLFVYKETDGTEYAVPLFFSKISRCAWEESSGRCRPETFIEGRKAHVEGIDIGGGIGIVQLTFTEPSPPRK